MKRLQRASSEDDTSSSEESAFDSEGPTARSLQVGDGVIARGPRGWQRARVASFDAEQQLLVMSWDDGDASSTELPCSAVFADVPPAVDDVGIGTIVLFPHGSGAQGDASAHYQAGRVVAIQAGAVEPMYRCAREHSGVEGQPGAPSAFLHLSQLRVSSNVFSLMLDMGGLAIGEEAAEEAASAAHACAGDGDVSAARPSIFLSFAAADQMGAMEDGPVRIGPLTLASRLRAAGVHVSFASSCSDEVESILRAMSAASVVLACVSSAYASDAGAREQLAFAKKRLRKPVLPLMLGGDEDDERNLLSPAFMQSAVGILLRDSPVGVMDFRGAASAGLYAEAFEQLLRRLHTMHAPSVVSSAQGDGLVRSRRTHGSQAAKSMRRC